MSKSAYRSDQDWRFVGAAQLCLIALTECIDWAEMVLKRAAADPDYRYWLSVVNLDLDRDIQLARDYKDELNKKINCLDDPETSTPEERRVARILIAKSRSWWVEWTKGENFRDGVCKSVVPPSLYDGYTYTSPSYIADVPVPDPIALGYDPFADNQ